ncbi:flavo protein [Coniophora puteana RWD-64-598 SS2]|uniref:Flavo protein n=1 Tax=Coniophora puteana (strain RWD-64-598) TaxID=741705 RepID=A0A5M3MZH4_CONPW|nr:flavo protein [Coniophora puteana RWD-64-598 SS2]EIW84204.1 flavo protein [Coniophora puteana RWD-64-598 SS2]
MAAKTVPVCNASDLKDGQMKEVDFEGEGKVLVYRLGDKVHATSAFCTHYGAPLSKGVLTADGRIVCPWHGACFNVCTGDIEDAPAPSAIHSFKAEEVGGKIQVTAELSRTTKNNMTRPPKLTSATATSGKGVVIVGGGSGAFYTIESLRENGYQGNIVVVSRETYPPIDRTKLSKALITDSSALQWRNAADLKIKFGVTLRIGVTVTSVDIPNKQVILDGGKESIPYDKLVLASGGLPRRLPVEGSDLENVFTFRGVQDAQKVDAVAQEGKRAVVIGSSFISMELAVAMSKRKLASLDVIGMEEYPFEAILGKEVGASLKKFHESQGVKFHMKSKVDKIVASDGEGEEPKKATGVVINGTTIPADFVVMGVGVAPATDFLKQSGFTLEQDGGVKVDEYLRVPGYTDVYAIVYRSKRIKEDTGDIAYYPQLKDGKSRGYRRIEHWNVAGNHGRAVGKTIAGKPQPFMKVPVFWSAQGQQLRYCGIGHEFDEVIIKGNPEEMKFIAFYVKDGAVTAVSSMQNDPVVSKCSELMRLGLMPTPEELKNGKDVLAIDLSSSDALPRVTS